MDKIKNETLMGKGGLWFPELVSTQGHNVDQLYFFILWGSILMFILLAVVVGMFAYKYRRTSTNQISKKHVTDNHALELIWSFFPLVLVMFIFVWGFKGYLKMSVPPTNAMEIRVIAKQWLWQFDYAGGNKSIGELVVPVNQPIRLVMSSEDVIHSFFVPNFRIKRDVIPNRYTRVWFEANKVGNYQIFCTEFCGDGHSEMLGTVRVMAQADYEKWLKESASTDSVPIDQLGEKLYTSKGCAACHSIDGSPKTGPTWKGLYGATRSLASGQTVVADDNYIRESIVNPQAKIVNGFPPVMPTFAGILTDREINGIIEYLKKLK